MKHFTLVFTVSLLLSGLFHAKAQETTYQFELDSEADWNSGHVIDVNGTKWDGKFYRVNNKTSFVVQFENQADFIDGEFGNGVTGAGKKEFTIKESSDKKNWSEGITFNPGTSNNSAYNYFKFSLREDTRFLKISYAKGANASRGAIKLLRVNEHKMDVSHITPVLFLPSSSLSNSVVLTWVNPDSEDVYGTYDLTIYDEKTPDEVESAQYENTGSAKIDGLKAKTTYVAKLVRTVEGVKSDAVTTIFTTPDKQVQYLVEVNNEAGFRSAMIKEVREAYWKKDHIDVQDKASFVIKIDDTPGYLAGEFNNGVTGVGDHHFVIEERDGQPTSEFVETQTIKPNTSNDWKYKPMSVQLKEDTREIRVSYTRGANASHGRIQNLKVSKIDPQVPSFIVFEVVNDHNGAKLIWSSTEDMLKSLRGFLDEHDVRLQLSLYTVIEGENGEDYSEPKTKILERGVREHKFEKAELDENTEYIVGLQLLVDDWIGDGVWRRFKLSDLVVGNEIVISELNDIAIHAVDGTIYLERSSSEKASLTITDMGGRTLLNKTISGTNETIDINTTGTVIVTVISPKGVKSTKVLVK